MTHKRYIRTFAEKTNSNHCSGVLFQNTISQLVNFSSYSNSYSYSYCVEVGLNQRLCRNKMLTDKRIVLGLKHKAFVSLLFECVGLLLSVLSSLPHTAPAQSLVLASI